MGDRFAYRVRVSGPDVEEYIRRVTETKTYDDTYEWTGARVLMTKRESTIDGYWYNATATVFDSSTGRVHQLLGNFSSAPLWFFLRAGELRMNTKRLDGGPFDGLSLNVEIVGMSNNCDVPGGKYSYIMHIVGGKITGDDGWASLKAAIRHAPDLFDFAKESR